MKKEILFLSILSVGVMLFYAYSIMEARNNFMRFLLIISNQLFCIGVVGILILLNKEDNSEKTNRKHFKNKGKPLRKKSRIKILKNKH